MELKELILPPRKHPRSNKNCPFCPDENPSYTTIPGERNDSTALGKNMNTCLVERGTRPKNPPPAARTTQLLRPNPIGSHPTLGPYSCEPHHLISGNQALAQNGQHGFQDWIVKSGKIEADTGYSVNNFDNGIWMPSVPTATMSVAGAWEALDRRACADWIMERTERQFHKGGHNIPETKIVNGREVLKRGKPIVLPDDKRLHQAYDKFLITTLKMMSGRMAAWQAVCGQCQNRTSAGRKSQPSGRVNDALDRLSRAAERRITGPRKGWTHFISRLAWLYHAEVCDHTRSHI
jgi:hypothetical protein